MFLVTTAASNSFIAILQVKKDLIYQNHQTLRQNFIKIISRERGKVTEILSNKYKNKYIELSTFLFTT